MFKGLKSNIISTLVVIVGLGMVMTVVVTAVFWGRDILQREVTSVRNQLSLLYGNQISADDLHDLSGGNKKKLTAIMQATGALAGRISLYGDVIQIPVSREGKQQVNLRRVVQRAIATGKTQKRLFGPGWGILLPTNKQLGVAVPVVQHDKVVGAVGVLIPLAPVYASLTGVYRIIFVYLLVNLLVLVVIGLFRFMVIMVRPVEKLVRMTDAYEEEEGIPFLSSFQGGDEFGQLSRSLNKMLERIERDRKKMQSTVQSLKRVNKELIDTRKEVIRAEKLASVGRLAAGLAHEIGNPLGVVQGYLGLLQQEDLSFRERKDFARRSGNELQRINGLVRQLLDFSRVNNGRQENISLHDILKDLVEMMSCQSFMAGITISTEFTSECDIIQADPDQIQQVFLNCLLNASDAITLHSGDRKEIKILSSSITPAKIEMDSGKKEFIEVSIIDTGIGIAEDDLDNIFDPFFTTKEPGKGTGLGLSVAHSIVEGCGGSIRVESQPGEGTKVIIDFLLIHEKNGKDCKK